MFENTLFSLTFVMIVVCGTETSTTICWSPDTVPVPCVPECGWGGCKGYAIRDRDLRRQFKCSNLFACLLNPLTPYLVTQWGEESQCLISYWIFFPGVNVVPLVSVLQTHLSRTFVFKTCQLCDRSLGELTNYNWDESSLDFVEHYFTMQADHVTKMPAGKEPWSHLNNI